MAFVSEAATYPWTWAKWAGRASAWLRKYRHYVSIAALAASFIYASYAVFHDISTKLADEKIKTGDMMQLRERLSQVEGRLLQVDRDSVNQTRRDPDGFYQLNRLVARVAGAREALDQGIIQFDEIFDSGEFNLESRVEYRQYILSKKSGPMNAMSQRDSRGLARIFRRTTFTIDGVR